jgi:putative transcriptional regulator
MIIINLDIMLARRKISSGELAQRVGITPANLSILKTGKAKAMRLSTLEAICRALQCQPGDILEFRDGENPPAIHENQPRGPETMEAIAGFCRALGVPEPEEGMGAAEAFYKAIGDSVKIANEEEEPPQPPEAAAPPRGSLGD